MTLIAHSAKDPDHLDGVHVVDVHAAARLGCQNGTVAGYAQHISNSHGGCPKDLTLQAGARPVPGRDLHDRLSPGFQCKFTASPGCHARRGRGVVREVDGRYIRLDEIDVLDQLLGGHAQWRRDLTGDHELPGFEGLLQFGDRLGVPGSMILVIALPPVRLADGAEDQLPGLIAFFSLVKHKAFHHFAGAVLFDTGKHIAPGLCTDFFPVQWWKDFQQFFLAAHFMGTLIDLVPDAGAGLIHIAMLGSRATTRTVTQTLRAFHRADKGGLLQHTVPAHAAPEQGSFDDVFEVLH